MPWLEPAHADKPARAEMVNIDHIESAVFKERADGRTTLRLSLPSRSRPIILEDGAARDAWQVLQQIGGVHRIELADRLPPVERAVGATEPESSAV